MLRTAFVAAALGLATLLLGPPLILLTIVTKSATLMYWTGVKLVVYVTRIAGEKVTVEGRENIPPGVCLFAANHTSNADAPAIVGAIPRRIAILGRKSLFDIPIVGKAFSLAKFVPIERENREMKKNSLVIRPGRVTVRFGKPIDASAYTVEQRGDLAERVHAVVAAQLPADQQPAES